MLAPSAALKIESSTEPCVLESEDHAPHNTWTQEADKRAQWVCDVSLTELSAPSSAFRHTMCASTVSPVLPVRSVHLDSPRSRLGPRMCFWSRARWIRECWPRMKHSAHILSEKEKLDMHLVCLPDPRAPKMAPVDDKRPAVTFRHEVCFDGETRQLCHARAHAKVTHPPQGIALIHEPTAMRHMGAF